MAANKPEGALQTRSLLNGLPVTLGAIAFVMSLNMWVLNQLYSIIEPQNFSEPMPFYRWFIAAGVAAALSGYGYRKKILAPSGAICMLPVGFFMALSNYGFATSLITFFASSSVVTKFRSGKKKTIDYADYLRKGKPKRNWVHIVCNGGLATELAILYLMMVGHGQLPIDFERDYITSWLTIATLGAMSCPNGDIWASELVPVIGESSPWFVTPWLSSSLGVNVGATPAGQVLGFLGGMAVGISFFVTTILLADPVLLDASPPQWPVVIACGLGGWLACLLHSVLEPYFQYAGVDENGLIHKRAAPNVKQVSGFAMFDNHSVNFIGTILVGFLLPGFSSTLWNYLGYRLGSFAEL